MLWSWLRRGPCPALAARDVLLADGLRGWASSLRAAELPAVAPSPAHDPSDGFTELPD